MFAETTNVFPGCFRLSARRVDMLREFHLALAGRGEVNSSNAPRDGKNENPIQMCRSNVDGFMHICTAISVPWRMPVRFKEEFTSCPDRVPRVARSDPEATGASHSRETKDSWI